MRSLLFFAILSLNGCSSQRYEYVIAKEPGGQREVSQVSYSIPSGSQSGSVQVSSLGVVEVEPKRDAKRIPAVHLRLTVSSPSGQKWLLNSQEQKISYPTGGLTPPAFVNSDSALPKLEIPPGELRLLDLYFALPSGISTAHDLPSFSFHWKVQNTDGSLVAEQTVLFNRRALHEAPVIVAPYGDYPYAPGWGPVWWGMGGYFYEPGPRYGPAFRYHTK